jgi:adenylate cyclase
VDQDAVNAVKCALNMERVLISLNRTWAEEDLPTIGMRVGIYTGPLVAGSLGSAERLEYSIIGDTVNTASRLESYDKGDFTPDFTEGPSRILIGEGTLVHLGDRFETRKVGEVSLEGKRQKTPVYRIIREKDSDSV